MVSIAVGIVCRNEADDLDGALASMPWAREIYVLNMGSTDHTVDVAARYRATVIDVPDVPVAERVRNRYLSLFKADWLLQVDCDERIHPDYHDLLQPILDEVGDTDVAAFILPFRLFALDVPLDHGMGTNPSVRLFRRGRVRYLDDQVAHRDPVLDGSLGSLVGRVPPIDHYAIRSIEGYLEKCNRYAKTEAEAITSRDELDPLVTIREFYRWTVVHDGWKDGFPGIAMATMLAFSRGLGHLYAWERMGGGPHPARHGGAEVSSPGGFRRLLDDVEGRAVLGPVLAAPRTGSLGELGVAVRGAAERRPGLVWRRETWRIAAYLLRERIRGRVSR